LENIRLKFTGHLAKFSDLEAGFGNEFQSKMNDFNQEISSENFPTTQDAFDGVDDGEVPF
jgi:replicative DNA helicase